jgi:hypothetical protein
VELYYAAAAVKVHLQPYSSGLLGTFYLSQDFEAVAERMGEFIERSGRRGCGLSYRFRAISSVCENERSATWSN